MRTSSAALMFSTLRTLRAPIVVVGIGGLFFSTPQQAWEVYRSLAQDMAIYGGYPWTRETGINWETLELALREPGAALLGLALLAFAVWGATLYLQGPASDQSDAERIGVKAALPALTLAFVPFIGMAMGLLSARTPVPSEAAKRILIPEVNYYFSIGLPPGRARDLAASEIIDKLFSFNEMLTRCALAVFIMGGVVVGLLALVSVRTSSFRRPVAGKVALVLALLATAALVLCGGQVANRIGPLAIFSIFLTCLVVTLTTLTRIADRHGVPYLALLGTCALVFSALDLNDNHRLDRLPARQQPRPVPELADALEQWYRARPDRENYERRGEPYPLYLVAAQGGGIYAAFQAASFLTAVQDICPAFASHLFAISGVSGGSVGSTLFSALLPSDDQPLRRCRVPTPTDVRNENGTLVDQTDDILSADLLSPLLSAALFPDLLQRFLPKPLVFSEFDRALQFERGLAHALTHARSAGGEHVSIQARFLGAPYLDHWSPTGNRPALLLNTTEVGTGKQQLFAPFKFAPQAQGLELLPPSSGCADGAGDLGKVSLVAAATASARFPWITPAASLEACDGAHAIKRQLVDGAYFENSGIATAQELRRALEVVIDAGALRDKIRLHVIALTGGNFPNSTYTGLSELTSPMQALLNARSARAYIALAAARDYAERKTGASGYRSFSRVNLSDYGYELPLGWRLSAVSMLLIRAQIGTYMPCERGDVPADAVLEATSACLLADIYRDLEK